LFLAQNHGIETRAGEHDSRGRRPQNSAIPSVSRAPAPQENSPSHPKATERKKSGLRAERDESQSLDGVEQARLHAGVRSQVSIRSRHQPTRTVRTKSAGDSVTGEGNLSHNHQPSGPDEEFGERGSDMKCEEKKNCSKKI